MGAFGEDNGTSFGHGQQLSDLEILSRFDVNKTEHIYGLDTDFL